ncbi:MAG TPA: tRNA (N6-threonylcarbamoyladenosine(37)-N6)-methyltransferase TrmO [Acidimicrobiia bacterium]|nr:tRNA (N6-threonylcarbamoyladenosine(37)-N6)-methyltransferase TrmO [Acidimicrobiia bacterium]
MADPGYVLHPIGWVESPLVDSDAAPNQGDEGAPDAWLVLDPSVQRAMRELEVGTQMIVLTWLDRADRDTLAVHPRGDTSRPATGVFGTRSPDRPNPIGLHTVEILAIEDTRIRVRNLEALDRTPVIDLKPVLGPVEER